MVLLLAKNSKAGCLFRPNFLKQVVIEIQNMEHPVKNFQSTLPPRVAKLEAYGLDTTTLKLTLSSYLGGRKQCVKIMNSLAF